MNQSTHVSTASGSDDSPARKRGVGLAILAGGVGALGAASCCILPLVLFTVGVSGAWIGNLTALAAYQPLFVALAVICLGFGFARVYRRPARDCADGTCGTTASNRIAKLGLWLATALIILAIAFPYIAPLFLDI